MKKLFALLVVAGMVSFVACGPSAEEKAAKAREDSIRIADSIAQVEAEQARIADSITAAQKVADSIAHADSIAKGLIKVK